MNQSSIVNRQSSIPKDFLWIFFLSLILRIFLIIKSPAVYEFDSYIYLLGLSSQYPLFTGFIKFLITCGFSAIMIRITIAVSACFGCYVFYLFTLKLFRNKTVAGASVLLMSIYPPFLVFSLVPYTEPVFILIFFIGLWFFLKENEAENSNYTKTGFFMGMACLTRFEAVLILPLILGTIIWQNPRHYFCRKSAAKLLKICLALFWGPVLLVIINYISAPEVTVTQSQETQNIIKELFPILDQMVHKGLPKLMTEIRVRGLMFPFAVFISGCILSGAGCLAAVLQDRKKHLVFALFIILATTIQLVPLVSNYRYYPGRIIGLRRHGMVAALFLLIYLPFFLDMVIKKLPMQIFKKEKFQTLALLILLAIPATASVRTAGFLITDYQKLYRSSYIQPHWIGKPSDAGAGVLTSVSDKVLMIHLQGTGLKLHPYQKYAELISRGPSQQMEKFIKQNNVKYFLIERDFLSGFNRFMKRSTQVKFNKLAVVGGWLHVYECI
ncbi:MAG: hypothetical protein GY749_18780 [Desulfobacteraceae bacterium]|nr:hypothetical protein [Desulfobacteraceae bacterium]